MNSRSSVNESNLVTFSPDLASLNALDKEPLLSFPFDHLYACHSQTSDCGQSLTLDKNVEISSHCLVQPDQTIQEKDAEILSLRSQNKKLKELLVYHLDLIQQQNDVITNREKTVVQSETVNAREKVEKQPAKPSPQRHVHPPPPPPLFHVPAAGSGAGPSHSPDETSPKPVLFNTIDEILGTQDSSESSYLFNTDSTEVDQKPFEHDITFDLDNTDALAELPEYPIPAILDNSQLTPLQPDFSMIERPIPVIKNEPKPPEPQPRELAYTITTNSGMPIIQKVKNRKKTTNLGSLSRMPKRPKPEPSTIYDNEIYSVNKKAAKTLNTYGKQSSSTVSIVTASTSTASTSSARQSTSGSAKQINSTSGSAKQSSSTNGSAKQISATSSSASTSGSARQSSSGSTRHSSGGGATQSDTRERSNSPPPYPFTPLSNRLQLIEPTPKGEDPYQLGEAEMREQSPISRLVLPKNNRVRVHTGEFANLTTPASTSERPEEKPKKPKKPSKVKTSRRKSSNTQSAASTSLSTSSTKTTAKSHKVKNEDVDWEPYAKKPKQTSLNDFSYGETALTLPASSGELVTSKELPSATLIPSSKLDLYTSCNIDKMQDISKMSYNEIFDQEQPGDENVEVVETSFEVETVEPRLKKCGARTTSLASSSTAGEEANADIRRGADAKRGGRKRALSSTSGTKREKVPRKPRASRGRGGFRGKRGSWAPVPALTTRSPYHTALGHPDISWYLGHDPDVKKEDVEQLAENTSSNVEVPRWREMIFTSLACAEGTENTDDDVYRKRHQKLEAEERRQLRWHMRRVREQRHVERLKLRQRDPWTVSTLHNPPTFSVWPSPLRDLQLIEITDIIPVLAFGEDIPKLPEHNFVLPWVRSSKAQKRSKRSKTLH